MSAQLFPIVRIIFIFSTVKCCDVQPLKLEMSLFIGLKGELTQDTPPQIKVLRIVRIRDLSEPQVIARSRQIPDVDSKQHPPPHPLCSPKDGFEVILERHHLGSN